MCGNHSISLPEKQKVTNAVIDVVKKKCLQSFLSRPTLESSSHGPMLPHGRGLQQGPQGEEKTQQDTISAAGHSRSTASSCGM